MLLPPGGARPGGRGRGPLLLGLLLDSTAASSGSSAAAVDLEAQPVLGELVRVNDVGRARPPARLLEAALKPARVFKASLPTPRGPFIGDLVGPRS